MKLKEIFPVAMVLLCGACATGTGTDLTLKQDNNQEGILLINVRAATEYDGNFRLYFLRIEPGTGQMTTKSFADLTGDAIVLMRGEMIISNSDNQEPRYMAVKVKAAEYQFVSVSNVENGRHNSSCIGDNMKFKIQAGKVNYLGDFGVVFKNRIAVTYKYESNIDKAREAISKDYRSVTAPFVYSPPIKSSADSCAGYGPRVQ